MTHSRALCATRRWPLCNRPAHSRPGVVPQRGSNRPSGAASHGREASVRAMGSVGSTALSPVWCSLLLTTKLTRPRCKKISLLSRSATAPGPHVSCGITSQRLHVQCRHFVLGAWGASISLGTCRMSPTRLLSGRPVAPRTMSNEAAHARRRFRSGLFSSATPRGWGIYWPGVVRTARRSHLPGVHPTLPQ